MTSVSYVPGDRTAVTGEGTWMLIDGAPESAIVHEVWRRIQRGTGLGGLMTGLLSVGFERMPDFALLAISGEDRHLICRGLGTATVISAAEARQVDGTGLATWSEHAVAADVTRVVLGALPADTDLSLPASAGVFLAKMVIISLAQADSFESAQVAVHSELAADREHRDREAGDREAGDREAGDTEYDDVLFGSTQARSIEDAAVRPADQADIGPMAPAVRHVTGQFEPVASPQPTGTFERSPATGVRTESASTAPLARPSGLIVSVPWDFGDDEGAHAPMQGGVFDEDEDEDEDEGITVRRSVQLGSPGSRPVLADHVGPVVQAVLCPGQHPSPPNVAVCRICGRPVPEQDAVPITRPVLGVLRLSTGDVISLDRGVIMGRNPPRAEFDGDERLHSVKLPDGCGEISRAHLKVTLDGWHVLVTDLRSTNGTLISLPGRDPEQMRPSEPVQIQPGTVVTLADGLDFRYEVT